MLLPPCPDIPASLQPARDVSALQAALVFWRRDWATFNEKMENLFPSTSRHGLGDNPLQRELLLPQVLGGRLFDLELRHGVAQGRLDLLLGPPLQLDGHGRVGHDFLDARNVGFELLPRLKLLAELFVAVLELGGVCLTLAYVLR